MKHWANCTEKERIERWENALRVLRSLTPHERKKHWDMSTFGEKTDCGTVACAAGHCGLDPWFRRRGLQLNFEKEIFHWGEQWVPTDTHGRYFEDLVEDFFGYAGCERIFFNGQARRVGVVIQEVRDYIKALKEGV